MLDPFVGSGTTLVEAKLLGRNAIGIDINPDSIKLSKENLNFICPETPKIIIREGNARKMPFLKNSSIDLICMHPPYADIIRYSKDIKDDISHLSYEKFLSAISDVAAESARVLKEKGICAFMIGDLRKNGYVLPLGMSSMLKFEGVGLILKEIVIKEQHNCKSSDYWCERKRNFLMLAHEYIFIFEKPSK